MTKLLLVYLKKKLLLVYTFKDQMVIYQKVYKLCPNYWIHHCSYGVVLFLKMLSGHTLCYLTPREWKKKKIYKP